MKIKYEFANGKTTEVEVSEEVGTLIIDTEKKAENLARKERYHCYSLDSMVYEGMDYADKHTPETELLQNEYRDEIKAVLDTLTDVQKRRLNMLLDGMSMREIANREGVSVMSVSETVKHIRKKFEKFLD